MPTKTTVTKTVNPIKKENTMPTATKKKATVTSPEKHPLSSLIPPMHFFDDYVPRTFPGGHTDLDLLLVARAEQINTALVGDTGTGKTSSVLAYCAHNRIPIITIHCNGGVDPSTLFSQVITMPDGTYATVGTAIITIMEEGGVIYLDEDNFLAPRIAGVFHGALDKRRQVTVPELNRTINLHPNAQFISSHNDGYAGTRDMNEAFVNRWSMKLSYEYDRKQEEQIVCGIPVLMDMADRLRAHRRNGELETPIGVNLLLEFESFAWSLGTDFAIYNFVNNFKPHEQSIITNVVDHFKNQIAAQRNAGVAAEAQENK